MNLNFFKKPSSRFFILLSMIILTSACGELMPSDNSSSSEASDIGEKNAEAKKATSSVKFEGVPAGEFFLAAKYYRDNLNGWVGFDIDGEITATIKRPSEKEVLIIDKGEAIIRNVGWDVDGILFEYTYSCESLVTSIAKNDDDSFTTKVLNSKCGAQDDVNQLQTSTGVTFDKTRIELVADGFILYTEGTDEKGELFEVESIYLLKDAALENVNFIGAGAAPHTPISYRKDLNGFIFNLDCTATEEEYEGLLMYAHSVSGAIKFENGKVLAVGNFFSDQECKNKSFTIVSEQNFIIRNSTKVSGAYQLIDLVSTTDILTPEDEIIQDYLNSLEYEDSNSTYTWEIGISRTFHVQNETIYKQFQLNNNVLFFSDSESRWERDIEPIENKLGKTFTKIKQ